MKKSLVNAVAALSLAILSMPVSSEESFRSHHVDDKQYPVKIMNRTGAPIKVIWVDFDGKASEGDPVAAGEALEGTSGIGHGYLVQDANGNVIQHIVIQANTKEYVVGDGHADPPANHQAESPLDLDTARNAFLNTVNQERAKRGLPPQQLDSALTGATQWLADHMAKYDNCDHDAVVIGGAAYANMQDIGHRMKAFHFPQSDGAEACAGPGEYADGDKAASDMALGWINSTTHYRPFLSQDGQVFSLVGFGIARSHKNPKQFYSCALYGTRQ